MPRAKLTAIVPVLNEEANIEDCLSRLTFADEILVVDSGSTDRTLDIARNFQARIIHRDYNYSASQKNWAIPQAKHEWVLVCDADERVTDQLREEIEAVLSTDSKYVGYSIPRATYFLGRRIRHCGWSPQRDRNVRLFLRDKGRYQDRHVHADVVCQGPVGRLNSPLVHYSFKTFEQYITKMNRYTTWAAKDIFDAGRNISLLDVLARPPATFIRMYLLQAGFMDGPQGLLLCAASASYTFFKYAKAWHLLRQAKKHPSPNL